MLIAGYEINRFDGFNKYDEAFFETKLMQVMVTCLR